MTLDERLEIGVVNETGNHTFGANEIKAFAAKYDPQPFHLDEEAAGKSIFGALCASGWHTTALWMRANVDSYREYLQRAARDGEELLTIGPSPGFENLKWLKPVFVGDTVTFKRTVIGHRPIRSRPGWLMLTNRAEAFNQHGDKVLEFTSSAMVKPPDSW